MRAPLRLTPATVLSLLALFFALGGSAFAVGAKVLPQARCSDGAIRGIATVVGDPLKGIANMTDQFTSASGVFARKFNCGGGPVLVRRVDRGIYDVKFVGNPAPSAIASPIAEDGAAASVSRRPDGSFRVSIVAPLQATSVLPRDNGFVIVAL